MRMDGTFRVSPERKRIARYRLGRRPARASFITRNAHPLPPIKRTLGVRCVVSTPAVSRHTPSMMTAFHSFITRDRRMNPGRKDRMDADRFAALTKSLLRYLPERLGRPLLNQPGSATVRPCAEHLNALLRAVITYLPRYLVAELLQDPRPGQVSGQFREATIMFADISGFTAMSERLSLRGEEGAEQITRIVGDYFTTMLNITAGYGGDLLKFGGDALLVAFFNDAHALNACLAGVEMQRAIARFSRVEAFGETFSLKMTVGLGSGLLFTANLGTPEKMEYTVMGEALANMAHAEDQAEGGEIFIDENTYLAVRPNVEVGETRNGCHKLIRVSDETLFEQMCNVPRPILDIPSPESLPTSFDALLPHLEETARKLDVLVPFLPPGLLDLLRFDPARMAGRERGEFRPVTVMFANFYGIEEIISHLGPPRTAEITAILNAHFSRMHEIIHRYEGVVDKVDSYVVGHRIMALFGAPRAHVDDPERAVRAAWEMQGAMAAFSNLETSAGNFALKQRIGINTGRVFAGNVGSETRHEYSVMGDEVNLTARLMSVAGEGQVLISQSTANQVGKRFRLEEKKPVRVKGKSKPVPNYEVRGVIERPSIARATRRAPLVGRDKEWRVIWEVAQRAQRGDPQILDIHGEMGMGKSRIIEELMAQWREREGAAHFAACLSYGRHTPYAPWSVILRDIFALHDDDSEQERREKIAGRLATAIPDWEDWAALVAQLVGVHMPESELLRSLDPKLRQQNLQRIVTDLILSEAGYRPTLLVLDDLQWVDEASLSLLNYLTVHLHPAPLLICVAYRPEEPPTLSAAGRDNYTAVSLGALSDIGSLELLDSQLPTEPEMPRQLKEVILRNAQGTPLFIVEMAHALIESYLQYDEERGVYRARDDLERVQVPDTVSRVILSRLDRLDEQSRNILKVASVIGREFQKWLLHSVYPYQADEKEIESTLLSLCEKEILDRLQLAYLFRHVMTREVAYESLLYAERRELHRQIARSIEEQQRAHIEEYLEVLAEHYTLAEEWPNALAYHLKAGRRAQSMYANEDAIHRYKQVLQIARNVPDSQHEQVIAHEGLGDVYQLVGRYDEALESYASARHILEKETPDADIRRHLADLYRKTGRVHDYRGEYEQALEWVERGLKLIRDFRCVEAAHLYLGGASVFHREGNFREAIRWCRHGLEIAETLAGQEARKAVAHAFYLLGYSYHRLGETTKAGEYYHRSLETYREIGDLPGMARAQNNLANFYFDQNDWEQATTYYRQALHSLERIGDQHGQAVIANNLGGVLLNRGKIKSARIWYMQSLNISQELGLTFGVALLHNNLGYLAIRAGRWDTALQHLQKSLETFGKIGAQEFLPELYRNLAEAHLGRGELDRALSWARRSLEQAMLTGVRLEEGCTRRVLGRVYHAMGHNGQAEQELRRSLETLQELGSEYEAARTAMYLAALYAEQGREEANRLRSEAIAVFERLGAGLDLAQARELAPGQARK